MARVVVGYFNHQSRAVKAIQRLIEQGVDPELINIVYDEQPPEEQEEVDFDNTIEMAPLIAFKEALFGADITEEDAVYYATCLEKGQALLSVFVPTNPAEDRDWESRTAKIIEDFMGDYGAFDHETRRVRGNRAGLTTYPQNRYMDPIGPNPIEKDRIYYSRSPLNGEVSNVIGVPDTTDYMETLESLSGRRVLSAGEALELRDRQEA